MISDGIGRDKDGNVLYPYGTTRDTFWPPKPEIYTDARTEFTKAIERSWWYNFDKGEISASWIQSKECIIELRVFRKKKLDDFQYTLVKSIKDHLDKRGTECDDEELRIVLNNEYREMKESAYDEIVEYQYYTAGIPIGKAVIAFELPKGLYRLPDEIVTSRKLDHFPYNFGVRAVAEDWLGHPIYEKTNGNLLWISEFGIKKMTRDELRDHLKARGEDYKRGELEQKELVARLTESCRIERNRRKVHWFCQADDKCRLHHPFSITFDPNQDGHEMVKVGHSLINSWDKSKGRIPTKVSMVYAHLREKHWDLLINRGYGDKVV
jgi:hypothetical protein